MTPTTITLTTKNITELRRLRRCLNSGMVPVNELTSFLRDLETQVKEQQPFTGSPPPKKSSLVLKEKYRRKLRAA